MRITQKWILDQLEVVSVGFPFCFFKYLSGLVLWQTGHYALGYLLMALCGLDLLINTINLCFLIIYRRRFLGACTLTLIFGLIFRKTLPRIKENWKNVGTSLDILLSFTLVAVMVGWGGLQYLGPKQLTMWNISVVLNVLGAGLGRVADSLANVKAQVIKQ